MKICTSSSTLNSYPAHMYLKSKEENHSMKCIRSQLVEFLIFEFDLCLLPIKKMDAIEIMESKGYQPVSNPIFERIQTMTKRFTRRLTSMSIDLEK